MLRNILTGVITTVAGTTAVYFLGFHNRGGNSAPYEVVKQATIDGWSEYVSTENSYKEKSEILAQGYTEEGFPRYKEETLKESEKLKAGIKDIAESKNIDRALVSLLKSRLSTWQQRDNKYVIHLANYEQILKTTPDADLKRQKINDELGRYWKDVGDFDRRFEIEVKETTKILTDKYGPRFAITDLKIFQLTNINNNNTNGNANSGGNAGIDWKMFIGKWQTSNNLGYVGTLYQNEDGRMYYYFFSGDSTYGRWQVSNNQVTLFYDKYFGAGYSFKYNLSDVTINTYKMTFVDSPYNVYNVTRIN